MACNPSLIFMVRHLIGDTTQTYRFTDAKISQSLAVAGVIVSGEYDFETEYTFDIVNGSITPDPSTDSAAMALLTLKSACMLMFDGYTNAVAKNTVKRIKDGDSEVEMDSSFKGWADIVSNGPCKAYQSLLKSLTYTRASALTGRAILTPPSIGTGSGYQSIKTFYDSLRLY